MCFPHSAGMSGARCVCLTGFIRTSLPDQIWKYGGLEEKTDFILIYNVWTDYGEDHKFVGNGILDCKSFFRPASCWQTITSKFAVLQFSSFGSSVNFILKGMCCVQSDSKRRHGNLLILAVLCQEVSGAAV